MGVKQLKLLTVPSNGQISIGKGWAGRQIAIEEIGEGEIYIRSGSFIPDSEKTFHTKEASETLDAFNKWEQENPPGTTSAKDVLSSLRKKRKLSAK